MATILRGPTVFRTWHKQPWAVAVGSQEWVWQDPMNLRLVGKDTFFRTAGYAPNYDYPNPTLPKDRHVSLRTTHEQQSDRNNNLLVKQDRIFGGPGMVPDYDWPNPIRPKDSRVAVNSQSWVWQETNTGLLVGKDKIWRASGEVPGYDWPNPRGKTWHTSQDLWQQNQQVTTFLSYLYRDPLFVRVTRPPGSEKPAIDSQTSVWQNYVIPLSTSYVFSPPVVFRPWKSDPNSAIRSQNEVGQQSILRLAGQDVLPENQKDWPLPTRVKQPSSSVIGSEDGVWQDRLLTTLLGKDLLPFNTFIWANLRVNNSFLINTIPIENSQLPVPPTPPSTGNLPLSGLIVNTGRMMNRGVR